MSRRAPRQGKRPAFGSVRKLPSGRFQARYTDPLGRMHTAPHTFETKTKADDWLATTRADIVRGKWRAPELAAVRLGDYAADYLAARMDLAHRTRETYGHVLARWINEPLTFPPAPGRRARTITLGDHELGALNVATIRDWYAAALYTAHENATRRAEAHRATQLRAARHDARNWARAAGLTVRDSGRLPASVLDAWHAAGSPAAAVAAELARPLTVPTDAGKARASQAYAFLRLVLNGAVDDGRIEANPCRIARAGNVKATERVPATPAEIDALAAAMPERFRAAVHVAAWSGLRLGELFALSRRHVDLDAGTVRVERALSHRAALATFGPPKSAASRRTVHLPPHVVTILRQHLADFTDRSADALVFTTSTGRAVRRDDDGLRRAFWRARAAIGRPDLRWHDLRHTGATLAAQAGASVRELQHRLGHSTVNAAMIYQHHSADRDRELAQRLSQLAAEPTGNVVALRPIAGDA